MPKIITQQDLVDALQVINPNITIIGEYVNARTKISVKCTQCNNIWEATVGSLKQGHGCPKCATTRNAKKAMITPECFQQ